MGCSPSAGVWIFGKQSQCLIPFGLCWGHNSFQSVLTSLSTPAVGKVLPSLLEAMFYITATPSFDEGFLSVLRFRVLKREVIWQLKQKMHHSEWKIRFYHRYPQLTLCFVVFKRQGCILDEIERKMWKFTLWNSLGSRWENSPKFFTMVSSPVWAREGLGGGFMFLRGFFQQRPCP